MLFIQLRLRNEYTLRRCLSLFHSISYILRLCLSLSHTQRYTNVLLSLKTWILEKEASGIFSQPPTDILEPIIFSAVEQWWRMLIASAAEF